ncbi:dTDP-4-dehydrorhamnose reductase [Gordonia neofelifaecis]|uniref:dTDP-4-dehydrorhamnose reductase n=1 Tax=Gordonia neofelifaecis NRRL B-59395 TaxID=644548 RepID=F1YFA0_9ACTN|nr:dTDP-4-dehydrorhamnose reductase [Gordonia neofelifaecis]EGD56639.1 dTDP-4-dehydrorhamnose reductase [Gordonia neofelifaecis NRRL B-59395]
MSSQQVFIVGAAGQVGRALLASRPDRDVVPLTSDDIDIRSDDSVREALAGIAPGDVVINAAGYTAVDAAESDREAAWAVNADGPANLAAVTGASGARLIHLSTDYAYATTALGDDGAPRPFEPADETVEPATVYGASKLEGDRAAQRADPATVVVRTAWVFTGGRGDADFVATMVRLETERDVVRVVDDQVGSPTYAPDLAKALWELVDRLDSPALAAGAVVHATNAGATSWWELARTVFAEVGADPERVQPCTTDEFPRPAPRPSYSVLSGASWAAAGLSPLRSWRDAVHDSLTARSDDHGLLG